ncbi:sigma-70 family RNA polymerase sigma factor [Brevibacterium sp.]|uniref:RNA polymerase sigma factor n=1 Tax=Brevibacterium sp. TaxID=1701 RepID=UPI0025C502A4|nr:sigma-70 family RNA polymerase sigma factor [Brevibacterium sp.]
MTPNPAIPEHALVLRAQDGDVAAFEMLVDRYQGRLFRIAYMILHDRMDAEDVVQESLVLAWRRLGLLEDPAAFSGWVSKITTRAATDVVRRATRRATNATDGEVFERLPPAPALGTATSGDPLNPEHSALVQAQMTALAGILQTLDASVRSCWVLREVGDMSYREIAVIVDATESTVRGRIARARAHIVEHMEEWR